MSANPLPLPALPALRARRALPRPPTAVVEAALFVAGVLAYFLTRGATEAGYAVAAANAGRLVGLERSLGLDVERWAQSLVLPHDLVVTAANWVYIYGHWPLIVAVAGWLAWRRPADYRWLRTAMLVSGAIGVVVFVSHPVAPPRLVPELGLVDTVSARSSAYRVLQPPSMVNQYAALPSLHVGWDLLVGLALLRAAVGRALRVLAVAAPLAMVVAVVVTGNHYLVDVLAGALVALAGAAAATWWGRRTAAPVVGTAVSVVRQRALSTPGSDEEDDEQHHGDDEGKQGDGPGVHRSSVSVGRASGDRCVPGSSWPNPGAEVWIRAGASQARWWSQTVPSGGTRSVAEAG